MRCVEYKNTKLVEDSENYKWLADSIKSGNFDPIKYI